MIELPEKENRDFKRRICELYGQREGERILYETIQLQQLFLFLLFLAAGICRFEETGGGCEGEREREACPELRDIYDLVGCGSLNESNNRE